MNQNKPYYDDDKPKGASSAEFWRYFDSLPREEREFINAAKDGPDMVWRMCRSLQMHPPGIDGKATAC